MGIHGAVTVLSGLKEIRLHRFMPLAFACLLTTPVPFGMLECCLLSYCTWPIMHPHTPCPCGSSYPKSHCIHVTPPLLLVQPSQASHLHCLAGHLRTVPIQQKSPQALLHLHCASPTILVTLCSFSEPHTHATSRQPPMNLSLPLPLGSSHLSAC